MQRCTYYDIHGCDSLNFKTQFRDKLPQRLALQTRGSDNNRIKKYFTVSIKIKRHSVLIQKNNNIFFLDTEEKNKTQNIDLKTHKR